MNHQLGLAHWAWEQSGHSSGQEASTASHVDLPHQGCEVPTTADGSAHQHQGPKPSPQSRPFSRGTSQSPVGTGWLHWTPPWMWTWAWSRQDCPGAKSLLLPRTWKRSWHGVHRASSVLCVSVSGEDPHSSKIMSQLSRQHKLRTPPPSPPPGCWCVAATLHPHALGRTPPPGLCSFVQPNPPRATLLSPRTPSMLAVASVAKPKVTCPAVFLLCGQHMSPA